MLDIPQKYYEQEGFLSLMGIGYTAALAVTFLGFVNSFNKATPDEFIYSVAIVGGGALATWGYLKQSGVLY
tara:strand:- start:46 stop:258 length:213 start_codon:yes stop_codon:yes gene_type:complete